MSKRILVFLAIVCALVIGKCAWAQESNQLIKPRQSKATGHVKGAVLMHSITASDTVFFPAPVLPTINFDLSYFSTAADDSIVFCLYDYDSLTSYWRPVPKLTALPVVRQFRGVPVYGIGVVRADTANTLYEIIWYK